MRFVGIPLFLLMAGCAGVEHAPPGSAAPADVGAPVAAPGAAPVEAPVTAPVAGSAPVAAPAPAAGVNGPPRSPSGAPGVVQSAPPVKKPPAKAPAPSALPAPAAPAPTVAPAAPAAAAAPKKAPTAPPLDLAALEARLRATDAIGMFTKITLKGQVDDLLDQFREYYAGRVKSSLAELRPPYDRLLLKVLALLQDEDPDLARAIVDSREPIWNILADPARFATL